MRDVAAARRGDESSACGGALSESTEIDMLRRAGLLAATPAKRCGKVATKDHDRIGKEGSKPEQNVGLFVGMSR